MRKQFLLCKLLVVVVFIAGCKESSSNDKKQELKTAIDNSNILDINKIIELDSSLLNSEIFYDGMNPLEYSLKSNNFISFKALIQMGADVNYIDKNKESLLMKSIRYYGSSFDWHTNTNFTRFLLEMGANPNYAIQKGFTNSKGGYIIPISPICKASTMDLDMVKLLIKYGADYKKQVGGVTPLGFAIKARRFDIIAFYIEELKIDINKPVAKILVKSTNKEKIYSAKDYIRKYMNFEEGSDYYKKTTLLLENIEDILVNKK